MLLKNLNTKYYTKIIKTLKLFESVYIRSFSCPYFPAFGLNTVKYSVSLRIQFKCWKKSVKLTFTSLISSILSNLMQSTDTTRQITRSSPETVPFHKISRLGNYVKLGYLMHCSLNKCKIVFGILWCNGTWRNLRNTTCHISIFPR